MTKLLGIRGFLPYTVMLFINALVDLGHKIIIQNTVFKIYDGQHQVILTAILNGLILLPYIVLFSPAGFLSDKYPKQQVMRYSAMAYAGISSSGLFYVLMATAIGGLFYLVYKLPHSLVRIVALLTAGRDYKVDAKGFDNLPIFTRPDDKCD